MVSSLPETSVSAFNPNVSDPSSRRRLPRHIFDSVDDVAFSFMLLALVTLVIVKLSSGVVFWQMIAVYRRLPVPDMLCKLPDGLKNFRGYNFK